MSQPGPPQTEFTPYVSPATPLPLSMAKESKSKRKRSKPAPPAVISPADQLDLSKDAYIHPCTVWGDKKIKSIKISPAQFTSPTTKVPFRIQLSGGGDVPFEVGIDQYGGTNATFSVNDEAEANALYAANQALIKLAIQNKSKWWPKQKKITDAHIRDNFSGIIFDRKEKDDGSGEFWPANVRTKVPISMVTGEPIPVRTKARQKVCMICDHDDAIISHHDMLHRSWDKLIIDIYGLYFKGKYGWGVTKYLSKVKLKFDADAEAEYQEVDFLPSTPPYPLSQPSPTKKRKMSVLQLSQDPLTQIDLDNEVTAN